MSEQTRIMDFIKPGVCWRCIRDFEEGHEICFKCFNYELFKEEK